MPGILLVEDSAPQAKRLAAMLRQGGFEVRVAASAEEGLGVLAGERFDLLITDLGLPGRSGTDLCRAVKADPRWRSLPVLLITAETDPAAVLRGLEAGAEGFMTKEHRVEAVLARVRRVLAAGARDPVAGPPTPVAFLGQAYALAAAREHLLDFLVSAFEDASQLQEERRKALETRLRLEQVERLERMRASLLNVAAHELGTPLTPMRVEVQMLRGGRLGALNERQQHALDIVARNVDRIQHVAAQVLDACKLQSGALEVSPTSLDLAEVARETAAAFAPRFEEKGVAFQVQAEAALPVAADRRRLAQVLANLVDNALRFTPEGGRVEVEARTEQAEAVLVVRDTGCGLGPEQLASLFHPFGHGHDPLRDARPGAGLGLYLGKGIVELHRGRLWGLSDGPGRGATFGLALPLRAAAPAVPGTPPGAPAARAPPPP